MSRESTASMIIKMVILLSSLLVGLSFLFTAQGLIPGSLSPDPPVALLKTLYNNDSSFGVVSATLTCNASFVIGADITAEVKVEFINSPNTSYQVEVMFPDAVSIMTNPPYTWQDWNYSVNEVNFTEGEQIQTLSGVTLVYVHEGLYGLNVTVHQPGAASDMHFDFFDLVTIQPLSYLQEKVRSNLSFAMNYTFLGLTVIMVAPIGVQLLGLADRLSLRVKRSMEKRQDTEKSQEQIDGYCT